MHKLFYPDSVVVVGVSPAQTNLGRHMVGNLIVMGFPGKIYAVGAEGGTVHGIDILPAVASLPEPVDLAAILTPARVIPEIMRQCGENGIRHAVILSAGFTELSDERADLQRELVDAANHYGIRFVGPNCMGLICTESRMAVPFAQLYEGQLEPGSLTILAQSGSIAFQTSWYATMERVGLAKFVSMGNKLNVDEVDLLPYFIQDPQTKTICMYLEGITRGRELVELARTSPKPIVVLKGNISKETEHAARSHTASLASDDRVVEGAFRQAGITRVHAVRDFALAAKALSLPPLRGNNIAGVVCSGGMSVIGTDYCHRYGFHMPPLPARLQADFDARARARVISFGNPVDYGDVFNNEAVLYMIEQVLALSEIDGAFIGLFHLREPNRAGPGTLEMLDRIAELMRRFQKPVAVTFMTEPLLMQDVKQRTSFPIFNDVEEAMLALKFLRDWSVLPRADGVLQPLPVDRSRVRDLLREQRDGIASGELALEALRAYGLPVAPWRLARDEAEAVSAAQQLGFPVALKAVASGLVHKSDAGGVLLDLPDAAAVRHAMGQLRENLARRAPEAKLHGALVQRYVPGGVELILGAKRDEHFGPVVMFGVGGIFAEALGEVAFRLAPLSAREAEAMIWELRGSAILKGVRGNPPADVAALVDAIRRLGQLIADHPEVREIDVNPIKAFAEGVCAVDARIVAD